MDFVDDNSLVEGENEQNVGGISNLISLAQLPAPKDPIRGSKSIDLVTDADGSNKRKATRETSIAKRKKRTLSKEVIELDDTGEDEEDADGAGNDRRRSKKNIESGGSDAAAKKKKKSEQNKKKEKAELGGYDEKAGSAKQRNIKDFMMGKRNGGSKEEASDLALYKCKKCDAVISDSAALIDEGGSNRRRLKFSRCKNIQQKKIEVERDSEESDVEGDNDGNWCEITCKACHHFFGNQIVADPPVYAFRKVDLVCSEPNNRPKKKKASSNSAKQKEAREPEEGTREVENLSKEAEAGKEKVDHGEEIEEKAKAASRSEQVESEASDLFLKGPLNIQRELSMLKYVVLNMMERIKKLETHQPQNKRHALTGQTGDKEGALRTLISSQRKAFDDENADLENSAI